MVTRKQSIENFSVKADDLIGCACLLSTSRISALLKSIASSRLLCEVVSYCLEGIDFDNLLTEYSMTFNPYPTDDKRILIGFAFRLFVSIDSGEIELFDILNNNYKRNNIERSYLNFCNSFVLPFKRALVEIAEKTLALAQSGETEEQAKKLANDKKTVSSDDKIPPVFVRAEEEDGSGRKNYLTCYSDIQTIVSEEWSKIMYSKLKDNEKKDLFAFLDGFRSSLFKGTKEEVRQTFVSYKYAVQNFKKLGSEVDDIGRILRFCGIID